MKRGDFVRFVPPPGEGIAQDARVLRVTKDRVMIRLLRPLDKDDDRRWVYPERLREADGD